MTASIVGRLWRHTMTAVKMLHVSVDQHLAAHVKWITLYNEKFRAFPEFIVTLHIKLSTTTANNDVSVVYLSALSHSVPDFRQRAPVDWLEFAWLIFMMYLFFTHHDYISCCSVRHTAHYVKQEIQQGWQTSAVAVRLVTICTGCSLFGIHVRHLLPTSNIDIVETMLLQSNCRRLATSTLHRVGGRLRYAHDKPPRHEAVAACVPLCGVSIYSSHAFWSKIIDTFFTSASERTILPTGLFCIYLLIVMWFEIKWQWWWQQWWCWLWNADCWTWASRRIYQE